MLPVHGSSTRGTQKERESDRSTGSALSPGNCHVTCAADRDPDRHRCLPETRADGDSSGDDYDNARPCHADNVAQHVDTRTHGHAPNACHACAPIDHGNARPCHADDVAQYVDTKSVFFAGGLLFLASFFLALRLPVLPSSRLAVLTPGQYHPQF